MSQAECKRLADLIDGAEEVRIRHDDKLYEIEAVSPGSRVVLQTAVKKQSAAKKAATARAAQPPLTRDDVKALAVIIDAADNGKRVRWLIDGGDVVEGTARCLAHDGGGFPTNQEDIRDVCLHVSGITERWLPVVDVMSMVRRGEFGVD